MKQKKLPTVASLAMATVVVAPAWSAEEGATEISEIVVTATRMETNLQDTPIAITAVTADAPEERGITGVGELTSLVPNAQFRRTQGAFGPGVSASIRGVGQADTSLAVEPAVAFYLDDFYYPLLLGSNFDLLDIDRIEVLRGPQGTLFGRNSLAGAVNIVSRQPSTTEFSSQAQVTFGAYDRRELRAGVNLPLSDEVALSLSGLSKKRTGYQRVLDFTCEMNRRGTPELAGSLPYADLNNLRSPGGLHDRASRWRGRPGLTGFVALAGLGQSAFHRERRLHPRHQRECGRQHRQHPPHSIRARLAHRAQRWDGSGRPIPQ